MDGDAAFQDELSAALSDRTLHLILLPTEQCNFRCTYCYEDFAIGRMERETINAVKLLLDRRFDGLQGLASFQRISRNLLAIRDSGLPVRILLRGRQGRKRSGNWTGSSIPAQRPP
jgi:hypothetical protein